MYSRKHRTKSGPAVAPARERGWTGTLELDVIAHTIPSDQFPQQVRATISEPGHKDTKLVPGIRHRQRL